MKTRAVVYTAARRVEMREIQVPELGPDEVLVRAHSSGVSVGTDGWVLTNQFTWGGEMRYPVIPGYQRSGWIEAVGADVVGLKVGQRVAATTSRLEGPPFSNWGGHLHHGVTPQTEVYPLDPRVSFANAAQMIVAQVGYNAATRSGAGEGRTVLVLGDGCIGQMAAQAARARGARVIVAGHRTGRLRLAVEYCADEALQTRDPAWLKRLASDESPISVIIDTVQNEAFFHEYLPHVRPCSDLVLSGFSPAGFRVDLGELQKREIGVLTVSGWSRQRNEETLALMAEGRIDCERLITHQAAAARAPEVYSMILEKSEPFLGINFLWESA